MGSIDNAQSRFEMRFNDHTLRVNHVFTDIWEPFGTA